MRTIVAMDPLGLLRPLFKTRTAAPTDKGWSRLSKAGSEGEGVGATRTATGGATTTAETGVDDEEDEANRAARSR